ncbi:membrane protein insertion efficiency factor YidD [Dehalococcoidia bacterium]|nr:membrane protein insertion efficiency factor YidD [Dehalococcoidia bacterium]
MSRLALTFIRIYQILIAPLLPTLCRYSPSCSRYAHEAIFLHGYYKGGWFALRRLCRCHPLGGSGYDPVPPATI